MTDVKGGMAVTDLQDDRNQIVRLHAHTVWRVALSRTRKEEAAQDVFQEVFMRLFEKERSFDSEEHRKAWLIRTTLVCCQRYFSATFKNTTLTLEEVGEIAAIPEEEHGLFAALLKMPAKYRILWCLAGGIAYSVGAVLYGLGKKHRYMHSVFHFFVLLGSIFQFICIFFYVI